MAEGYWVIRTYQAGPIGEKIKYWIPGTRPTESVRRMKSDVKQQQRNEANAIKRLARDLNENFWEKDVWVTLKYNDEGLEKLMAGLDRDSETFEEDLYMAAQHQIRLWRDRVVKACKAAGIEVMYVITTSDMDGKTGEYVRVHHHVVMSGKAAEIAKSKWKFGSVSVKHLFEEVDRSELAAYMLNQVRHMPDEKKYIPSRNLKRPEPKDRIAKSGAELSVPKGGQLLYRAEYQPGRPQYIRYIVPDVEKIRSRRKNE